MALFLVGAAAFPVSAQVSPSSSIDQATLKEAQVFSSRLDALSPSSLAQFKKDYPVFSAMTPEQIDVLRSASSDDRTSLFVLMRREGNGQSVDFGQTSPEMVTVATVGFQGASIVSQEGNTVHLAFDLTNKEGVQSDIRLIVRLTRPAAEKGKPEMKADSQVLPDTLILGAGSTPYHALTYTAPEQLTGSYGLTVEAWTGGGIMLATQSFGSVTFSGNGQVIEVVPGSCKLSITGKDGPVVLVDSGDVPAIRCDLKNPTARPITLTPAFQLFPNTVFAASEPIMAPKTSIVLGANEQKTVILTVAPVSAPGPHILRTTFTAPGFHIAPVDMPVIVQGEWAVIENLLLDKTAYRRGETATLSLIWNGASGTTTMQTLQGAAAQIAIGSGGEPCSKELSTSIAQTREEIVVPITRDCMNPKVTVQIKNRDGKVLAASMVNFGIGALATSGRSDSGSNIALTAYVAVSVIILLLIIVFSVALRNRTVRRDTIKQESSQDGRGRLPRNLLLFFLSVCSAVTLFGISAKEAKADTISTRMPITESFSIPIQITYGLDKTSYQVGDTVLPQVHVCAFGSCDADLAALSILGSYASYTAEIPGTPPPSDYTPPSDLEIPLIKWFSNTHQIWDQDPVALTVPPSGDGRVMFHFFTGNHWLNSEYPLVLLFYLILMDPDCIPKYPGDLTAVSSACTWRDWNGLFGGLFRRFVALPVVPVPNLKICADSCGSGQQLSSTLVTIPVGTSVKAVACYNTLIDCSSTNPSDNVTNVASWADVPPGFVSRSGDIGAQQEIVTGDVAGMPTVSATYSGQTASFIADVTPLVSDPFPPVPKTLKVCLGGCSSGFHLDTGSNQLILLETQSKDAAACFSDNDCVSTDPADNVSDAAVWTDVSDPDIVGLPVANDFKQVVIGNDVTGSPSATTTVDVSYMDSGTPYQSSFTANVICAPNTVPPPSIDLNTICTTDMVSWDDTCGGTASPIPGNKQCGSMEWREVAP